MKKIRISKVEADQIEDRSKVANEILTDERFQFIRDYLQSSVDYIEESILNNTIKDVDERVTITGSITKIFKTPKKQQIDEMVGQYKFIKKFLSDVDAYSKLKKDLDKEVEEKRVILDD